ncbi:MAG: PQQ-binding-like beta-propeller repeat protein [Polyangiaceae bacterium]
MSYRDNALPLELVFTTFNGQVTALDLDTGRVCWQHVMPTAANPALEAGEERLFLFSTAGVLTSLDAASGQIMWSAQLPIDIPTDGAARVVVRRSTVLVMISGTVYAYAVENGSLRWQARATNAAWPRI